MKKIISNAFTLQMIADLSVKRNFTVEPLSDQEAAEFAKNSESSVGHTDAATVMSSALGVPVAMNRRDDRLDFGDQVLVGQYTGGRLPEGATTLPEGKKYTWLLVTIS